jgi:Flp pilus assembly pilin Flp
MRCKEVKWMDDQLMKTPHNALDHENGQTVAEYAIILVLIMVVAVGALTALGGSVASLLNLATSL